ncbi:Fis family transcriptional regulator [Dyella japonica A8]|uniref:Fis family transcriptional regulator n=1 Tax=Dyella japonica A8 TaxID=1217721 RepID=A0A075K7P0_9GAMM|nr:Fis family transcriptional regulator [Dyella japonica A8]
MALVREGCAGNATAFQLRLSRLIARLRREKSPLAAILSKALSEASESRLTLARDSAAQQATLSPVDADSNLPLTTIQFPAHLGVQPVWAPEIEAGLESVIQEWQQADKLIAFDLEPSRTLLLSGPPGVGKTLAATYLAEQLHIPLVTLNLAAAVNSLLGKTGNNLVRVLSHARSQPCVLLLDEFDAFAKRRDDGQDVGELKRVVNVLLQAIDEWPSTSLLVAATNHEELLDRAVFRRFDLWLRFPESTKSQVETLLLRLGCDQGLAAQIAPALAGHPLSDTPRLINRARRQVALNGVTFEEAALSLIAPETLKDEEVKRYLQVKRMQAEGKSMRAIGKELHINASTVSRLLSRKG